MRIVMSFDVNPCGTKQLKDLGSFVSLLMADFDTIKG